MEIGMIIYFVALGVLDAAFLLGLIYMFKCYEPDPNSEDEGGAGIIFLICGIGFIITSVVIAKAGFKLAALT